MRKTLVQFLIIVGSALAIFLIRYTQSNGPYITILGFTQGTTYKITYRAVSDTSLKPAIDSLLLAFDYSLSIYNPNSIISKINRNIDIETDQWFKTVFCKSAEVNRKTDGAFDISVAPLVNAYGFGFKNGIRIDSASINHLKQFVGMDKVTLSGNRVIKAHPKVMLDVNAIAQGYAVDVVSAWLQELGIKHFLVEIGGEIAAKGKNPKGLSWKVGIDKPLENNTIPGQHLQAIVTIKNRALATSGNYRKFIEVEGNKVVHILDPRTGTPALSNLLSATIIANDCITADAFATACMVMGLDKSIEFLEKQPQLAGYLIYSDDSGNFQTYISKKFDRYIAEEQ